jgi:phage-related protein
VRGVTSGRFLLSYDDWLASSCDAVQQGLDRDDWKPMQTVGPGVREIRIHIAGEHRVFCLATRAEAIYVLHAFEKKTEKTSAQDLRIGRHRFCALGKLRQQHGKKERG